MDKDFLTEEREKVLVDFLRRWGIDDPELMAEMVDHYAQKAEEEMRNGYSFEAVVDSWKTKKTFHTLRSIQKNYSDHFGKRWFKEHCRALINIFTTPQAFILPVVFVVLFFGFQWGFSKWIYWLFLAKAGLVLSVLIYAQIVKIKDYPFLQFRLSGFFWFGSYLILSKFISDHYGDIDLQSKYLSNSVFYTVTVFIDLIGLNLFYRLQEKFAMLSEFYFKVHEKPVRK